MKKRNLLLFASATLYVLLTGFSVFYPGGAPAGYTGSPGDGSNCSACHGTAATTSAGWITSNIPVAGYTPGQTYQITATNNMTGSGKYGFEVSPQNSSGTLLGTLSAGTNNKLVNAKYVTHTSASNSIKTWTFSWTAPAGGTGSVTFYGAFARNYSGLTTLSTLVVAEQSATLPAAAGTISGSANVCGNSTTTYSVGTINGASSYVWSVPSGASITAGQGTTGITVNFGLSAVSGNVSVYGTNSVGNGASKDLAVTVNTTPAQPGVISGYSNICQGTSQGYSVTNVAGVTYAWVVPTGWTITSGQGTSSITATSGAESGNIKATPGNSCGYGIERVLAVAVNTVPAQPSTISGSASPCQGSSQTYSVTNVAGVTYTWAVPSGTSITAGQGTNSITAVVGGSGGNINVVPSNTCGGGIEQVKSLTIKLFPGIPASVYGPELVDLSYVNTSEYTATAAADADSYQWELSPAGAGSISGTGLTSSVTWYNTYLGPVLIRVKGINTCGEGAWSVAKSTQVINTTGIIDAGAAPGMKIYPSPSNGSFTVALNGMKEKTELRLLDLTGREMYKAIVVSGQEATKLEYPLAPGIYLVQVKEGSNTLTQKLIVR